MSASSLYAKHVKIALAIAAEIDIPGCSRDDLQQEARVALWEACRSYDPARGSFPSFARKVIACHLIDLLRVTTKRGKALKTVPLDEDAVPALQPELSLARMMEAFRKLSPLQRQTVTDHLNGLPATSSKRHDNALALARRKLREAA